MDGIKIEVTGNIARVTEKPRRITAGTVGLPVKFTFDSQWDGMSKTAVFMAGCKQMIEPNVVDTAIVPWELLQFPCVQLNIGVYGVDADGLTAIPTTWAKVSVIYPGVDPGQDPAIKPTPNVWLKVLNSLGDLAKLATTAKDNIVNAINELCGKFSAHTNDKTNPHGVTAEQAGARPNTWTPTAEEVGARSNTWMPTSDDVGAVTRKLLWQNASPNSTFAKQGITLEEKLSDFDGFEVIYFDEVSYSYQSEKSTGFIPRTTNLVNYTMDAYITTAAGRHATRQFNFPTGWSLIMFTVGGYYTNSSTTFAEDNQYIIPYRIYGIKGVK